MSHHIVNVVSLASRSPSYHIQPTGRRRPLPLEPRSAQSPALVPSHRRNPSTVEREASPESSQGCLRLGIQELVFRPSFRQSAAKGSTRIRPRGRPLPDRKSTRL